MSYNPPPQQPPWGQPPAPGGPSPYTPYTPYTPPAPQPERSKWARKRVLIPAALMLFFIGVVAGSDGETKTDTVASKKVAPAATVTATVTATPAPAATVTATATVKVKPEPAPTVTKTKTVHVTVAPAAGGSDDSSDDSSGSGGSAYYANCTAVRAAGAAPIRTGDAGYGRHLDRDGDGVACE